MERSERSNHSRKIMLNTQKSAEVIVVERRRTKSVGVLSITEKGGMTYYKGTPKGVNRPDIKRKIYSVSSKES